MRRWIANLWVVKKVIGKLFVRTHIEHVSEYPPEAFGRCLCVSCRICWWHRDIVMAPELPEARAR